ALYTKGESKTGKMTSKKVDNGGIAPTVQLTFQLFLLLASVVVINMQHISHYFQISFLPVALFGILCLFKLLSKTSNIYFHLSVTILLVQIFLITVFLSNQFIQLEWIMMIIVIFNFICWFFIGYKYKLKYLQYIGVILMVVTLIYIFFS